MGLLREALQHSKRHVGRGDFVGVGLIGDVVFPALLPGRPGNHVHAAFDRWVVVEDELGAVAALGRPDRADSSPDAAATALIV